MINGQTCYLAIDFGGNWLKASWINTNETFFTKECLKELKNNHIRIKNGLHENTSIEELISLFKTTISILGIGDYFIKGIGISIAGIVNYHGDKLLKSAPKLKIFQDDTWISRIEKELKSNITLINDADATAIGLAETNNLNGNKTIGVMPVGTGLGFTVWRNGRRWRPGKSLTLLGSISTSGKNFNEIASASKLASFDNEGNLVSVLLKSEYKQVRREYLESLVNIIKTAFLIYNLDELVIGGGLVDAAQSAHFPLTMEINERLRDTPEYEFDNEIKVKIAELGNNLQLIGALSLARGQNVIAQLENPLSYDEIATEAAYDEDLDLPKMSNVQRLNTLWKAEQEAGKALKECFSLLDIIVEKTVNRIHSGGRLIYVGCGTSGRIAAMDAVEIPCTFGFPSEKMITLISGGVSDVAMEIESDFEEDASAVPEMLLLNILPEDVVIGISASGSAHYVQSALSFAKSRGALTVIIQTNHPRTAVRFCEYIIPLNSGNEVIAGSTRMKAGTATKKILNFFSTSVMVNLGKVYGSYMIDVNCVNKKIIERAQNILQIIYGFDKKTAHEELVKHNMNLNEAIRSIQLRGIGD
ncbi:N-acetylmuramic acid 6-phosphate etherase [Zhouia amylolytica]|uniref:SIS domain-containing protein n=1 Tax=Zhouia amylolytica AD3 TaxID=1286632 RepID=W2US60_9FLAO|nr:N-acetylmuramic acid 6-phosphate etherase [Zhouia amylolytica]ETN96177.1 hypothetical protein P278_09430 [Zhouia amylolytica AD3]